TERNSGFHRHIAKRAIALIAIKLVGFGVIGDQQIGPAVLVVIDHGDAQGLRTAVKQSARRRAVFKGAVAAIVKEPAGLADISFGRAVGLVLAVQAAEHIVLTRPLHVITDEQIEAAVAIIIEP